MRALRRSLLRLATSIFQRRDDDRLRDEVEEHLALQTAENIRTGLSPVEARRLAVLKCGAVEAVKEHYRDQQAIPVLECLLQDIRYALRQLRRAPWFTLLGVATLGVAIGGTTALFSLVDAVILRQLPFSEPQQLVEIWGQDDRRTGMRVPGAVLDALRARSKTLQTIGTHDPTAGVLNTPDGAMDIRGETVSANFVDVFGVAPVAGRGFVADDGRPGAPAVMLVSSRFWRQHLGSDPNAVGRTVYLGAVPYTVIGIMPPEFRTRFESWGPEFWTVYAGNVSRVRERELGYELVARLSRGVTIEQARREVDAIASGVQVDGWREAGRRIGLVPLKEEVVGSRANALMLLMAAVAVVLAIACANLAQLLLARSDHRIAEFATRKALGARSVQLFRLALFESLLLSIAGGLAGIVLAYWLVPVLLALAPSEIPRLAEASVDGRVMATAIVTSVLTGCVFGLAPAVRLSRLSVVQAMKRATGAASKARARFRSALVVIQVAAAVTLLAVAGLVLQTFVTLLPSSPGFATESRAAFIWSINERQFPDVTDRRRRLDALMQRLETEPGIVSVAVASGMPFGDDEPRNTPVRLPDDARPVDGTTLRADVRAVSMNFFKLFEIPLLYGRPFATTDSAQAPRVAIVNRTLARRLSPSGNAVGQSFRVGSPATAPTYEVVGVVEDTRWWGTTLAPLNEIYIPLEQDRASFGFVIVESQLDTAALTKAIRASFNAILPGAALPAARRAMTLDEMVGRSIAGPRFNATLVGSFSVMAMVLAVIGLFGLVAYSVSQRRRELALRAALGARSADLVAESMRSAVVLTATGIVAGLSIAVYLMQFIERQLYAIDPLEVPTFAGAAILMIITAGVAAYWPARRAANADPMTALRYE
jgi:putative ABC transport system permease protein